MKMHFLYRGFFPTVHLSACTSVVSRFWRAVWSDVWRFHLHKWVSQILMSGDNTKVDSIKMCFNDFFNLLLWIVLNCARTDSFSGGKTWRSGKPSPKYSPLGRKNMVPFGATGLCWLMDLWQWVEQKKHQEKTAEGKWEGIQKWPHGLSEWQEHGSDVSLETRVWRMTRDVHTLYTACIQTSLLPHPWVFCTGLLQRQSFSSRPFPNKWVV